MLPGRSIVTVLAAVGRGGDSAIRAVPLRRMRSSRPNCFANSMRFWRAALRISVLVSNIISMP